ncbi:MAG: hypothetical protein HRU09_11740 [Oligoflexales bacterium]|nr:hypothetical protein [Oligoflexales bacterium]
MSRYLQVILILGFWHLNSCGNWKSLLLQEGSEGVRSVTYPTLYFNIQNLGSESGEGITSIPVTNASGTEIARLQLNSLSLSMGTVYLHTDDFPNLESVAKDVSFSFLNNAQSPEDSSSLIPQHPSGFRDLSILDLGINLDGTLVFGEEEHRVIYKIDFSNEAYLFNDNEFQSVTLDSLENRLILAVNPNLWFNFSSALSDTQIQTELQSLGTSTEVQETLINELLENIQRSFVFGIDKNGDAALSSEESNNRDYFDLAN